MSRCVPPAVFEKHVLLYTMIDVKNFVVKNIPEYCSECNCLVNGVRCFCDLDKIVYVPLCSICLANNDVLAKHIVEACTRPIVFPLYFDSDKVTVHQTVHSISYDPIVFANRPTFKYKCNTMYPNLYERLNKVKHLLALRLDKA